MIMEGVVRMRAAVLAGVNAPFELADVELDPPLAGEVLVRIAASGLCRSDLNAISGKRTLVPFPAVLGHEASGEVVACGPGVTRLRNGDRVVLSILPWCGTCKPCSQGRRNYCTAAGAGMAAGTLLDGTRRLRLATGGDLHHFLAVSSFAPYAVVPESGVVVLPPGLPLVPAALLSCAVLTGFGAVRNTAQVKAGTRVAVFGCGGVGLNIVQGARLAGAAQIVAVDVSADKLELARRLGATAAVHAGVTKDPAAAVRRELSGGADYAFEALGVERTIQQAWASLDVRGQLILVGLLASGARLTLDAGPFVNEQSVTGCYLGSADPARDIPLLADHYQRGELALDELITRQITLDELGDGFDDLRAGRGARSVLVFGP
jgi:S-(hydroxymethyl)glutathione dehydrogenase / alcohol dehydrogenase